MILVKKLKTHFIKYMDKYKIEFTKKQLSTVATALKFYSRFLAGQWEIPNAMEMQEYVNQGKSDGFWEKRNEVEKQLLELKSQFTKMRGHGFYGIGSDKLSEDAKIAYDTYRPILEQFAKEYNMSHPEETGYSVYDFPGLSYSQEGRIKVKRI